MIQSCVVCEFVDEAVIAAAIFDEQFGFGHSQLVLGRRLVGVRILAGARDDGLDADLVAADAVDDVAVNTGGGNDVDNSVVGASLRGPRGLAAGRQEHAQAGKGSNDGKGNGTAHRKPRICY